MSNRTISKLLLSTILSTLVLIPAAFSQEQSTQKVSGVEESSDDPKQEQLKTFTKDELDAALEAARFAREMQLTKDVKPLLTKYGAPNYGLWISRTDEAFEYGIMEPEFAAKVSPALVRDLHCSFFNWFYLGSIWNQHQVDDGNLTFPPEVVKILKSDPILSKLVDDDDEEEDEAERKIKTSLELSNAIKTLDKGTVFFRNYLARFPKVKTRIYPKTYQI